MRCDESIEDIIIEYTEARLVICQMVVSRFIVVIEHQSATSCNDPLRRLSDRQAINLVQIAVESLHSGERTDIPHPDHARDIRWDNLVRAWDPLNADQAVVVAFKQEDFLLHMRVPDENVVIETCTQDQIVILVPI